MLSNVAAAVGVLCSGEKGTSKNRAVGQLSDRGPGWGLTGKWPGEFLITHSAFPCDCLTSMEGEGMHRGAVLQKQRIRVE